MLVPTEGTEVNRITSNSIAVYTVELLAILVAIRLEKTVASSVLVCLRCLQSKSRQDILYETLNSVTRITNQGGQVKFEWVPGTNKSGRERKSR